MKRTLFPTHAIFHKALILFTFFILIAINSFSQSGEKWATGGNGVSPGDFLGTTNNYPLLFKTNNVQQMSLSTDGVLQLNNLMGSGNRLLQTDANGKIIPFPMGPSSKVLYGDGTWGALPTIPTALWSSSGYNVYYLGKVGIGTNSPIYPLDVIGDARISNNLYVGGGIVITDKVNANSEVKTGMIKTDSIVTDSTRGFYGTTKFNGDVRLQNKLSVDGTTQINGDLYTSVLKLGTPADNIEIKTISIPGGGKLMGIGTTPSPIPSCTPAYTAGNVQFNRITINNAINLNAFDFRNDGTNAFIDFGENAISTTNPPTTIKINSFCSSNIDMCAAGGNVYAATTPNGKVGIGTTSPIAKFELRNDNPTLITAIIGKVESATQTRRMIFEPKLNFGDYNALTQAGDAGIIWSDGSGGAGTNSTAGLVLAPWPNLLFDPSGIRITAKGEVGIGIAIPDAMLDVQNKIFLRQTGIKVTNQFINTDPQTGIGMLSIVTDPLNKTFVGAMGDGTTNTENFVVYGDGHVMARDIKVTLDPLVRIPDYVFEKSYKLMSIDEVENYIKKHKHLPSVPSASEIKKSNGINLGEMSTKQLEKIEELTLYIIDLNKKLNELTRTVEGQQKEIQNFKNK